MKSSHEKISDTISAQTINAWIVAKTYCHTVSLGWPCFRLYRSFAHSASDPQKKC